MHVYYLLLEQSLADNIIAYWKTQENLMKNYQAIREFHELSEYSI